MSMLLNLEIADDCDLGPPLNQEDEDGLGGYVSPASIDEIYLADSHEDGSHGSSQGLEEREGLRPPKKWKIDHSSGIYKMKRQRARFDGARAIDILQRSYTLNYGSKREGSCAAGSGDQYYPVFRLDFISIIGLPLRPICRESHFFDNITISFRQWQAPYSAKHAEGIPFDLAGRTFRIATGATREVWFIVMHPTSEQSQAPAPSSQKIKGKQRSALARHRAETIACYITDVFLRGELLGEGVEPGWVLGALFHGGLGRLCGAAVARSLLGQQPAGLPRVRLRANIEIKVNPGIEKLEREVHSRVYADQEDDSEESDTEAAADAGDESPASGLDAGDGAGDGASNDAAFYEWVIAGSRNESTRGSSTGHSAPTAQISLAERPGSLVSMDLDTVAAHAKPLFLREPEEVEEGEAAEATTEAAERAWEDEERVTRDGEESDSSLFVLDDHGPGEQDGLYSDGLKQLRRVLEEKYDIDNIDYVSYALAVDVHCAAADQSGSAVCLLADRNQVMKEFYGSNYTFYPLGFHPAYGNFTSDSPPAFLDHNLFTVMKSNMSHQNQGADVLSFGFFQGYSNLKRSFRHREDDLLASQGSATAALTIPATEAARTAQWRAK
ncbi:hypothetical protein TGAM01_v210879 [Trichoderma gamsii]|uniref:Uncharacterized protein n=1 Tax=Trichoderma gamsii TaxID=398673 RepID=A0A2P4Z7H5_9HYPO|nr:hypothetical protein TGAM01_v210879 [Trichoderma gamsii]PON20237.1 hypothetical protein TGAM01_v210879 [Trichoderma gamsii]